MYDFIGDIHGHADQLVVLLKQLGYQLQNGAYRHPERKAFFVGDYIDRGPQILETLKIVKAMVEADTAIALMGNHEYNALCFHHLHPSGGHLRTHLIKNIVQHYETLKQFQNRQKEYEYYIDWFYSLPLFYETEDFRAVHACWSDREITKLRNFFDGNLLTRDGLLELELNKDNDPLTYDSIEITLKGKELKLPDQQYFLDKDGNKRTDIRIKWWENPLEMSYASISVIEGLALSEDKITKNQTDDLEYYPPKEKPVFFGHYWLKGLPQLFKDNVCCLDYSVAKKGHLVAYRFDGEQRLDPQKFQYT
jgi:hypothetical protein